MSGTAEVEPFEVFASRCRQSIDAALARWLPGPPATPALLDEALRYSLQAGGKRLRPILTLAAADAVARAADRPAGAASADDAARLALPAACALELIHTYSLIHDDLPAMDDDTMRRGRPTLHVVFGEGIAILAGDALLTEAFALLAREPASTGSAAIEARKLRVIARVASAAGASGMVGGQAVDLEAAGIAHLAGRPPLAMNADSLPRMHAMKTGALIRAAAVAGATMAGGSDQAVEALDRFAAELGLAFQIVDDILDVEGASADLGKTAGKDAAAGKPTYPSLFGLAESRALAEASIARAEAALAGAGLEGSHLMAIAGWVVGRDR